jgi:hypothetical protein
MGVKQNGALSDTKSQKPIERGNAKARPTCPNLRHLKSSRESGVRHLLRVVRCLPPRAGLSVCRSAFRGQASDILWSLADGISAPLWRYDCKWPSARKTAPVCGGNVVEIIYGYAGPEPVGQADRGEIVLGGCCVDSDAPRWQWRDCGERWAQAPTNRLIRRR